MVEFKHGKAQDAGASCPDCCLWSGHIRKLRNPFALSSMNKKVVTKYRSPFHEWFLEGCSSPSIIQAGTSRRHGAWCKQYLPG